jgi:permuted papain-like amidase YaeF/Yiix C92 family enzyme
MECPGDPMTTHRLDAARTFTVREVLRCLWFTSAAALMLVMLAAGVLTAGSVLGTHEANHTVLPSVENLRNGDLIFRSGVSTDSRLIELVDPGSKYSHVGLIDVRDGNAYVIHIEPGETDAQSKVRREPLADFLAPDRADGFAVFHVTPADDRRARSAIHVALTYQSRGVTFDHGFDLDTYDQMYCTELVWRAYLESGLDLLGGDFGVPASSFRRAPLVRLTGLAHSRHLQPAS